jgi:hypothetical protein
MIIWTPNLEKLGNEDLVEGLSNHGVTSQNLPNKKANKKAKDIKGSRYH